MVASSAAHPERSFQPRHVAAWTVAFSVHLLALMWLWDNHAALAPSVRQALPPVVVQLLETPPPPPVLPPEPEPPAHAQPPRSLPVHRAPPVPAPTPVVPSAPLTPMSVPVVPVSLAPPNPGPALPAVPDAPPTELAYRGPPRIKYPVAALRARQSGQVTLTVHVSVEGVPLSVQVKRSSGVRALDDAAVAGVKTWRFKPATRNGAAVEGDAEVSVAFKPDA